MIPDNETHEDPPMEYQVASHHLEPQAIVSIRGRIPQDDLPAFMKRAFSDLFGRLRLLGCDPAGPPFAIYHAFGADGIDAEASVPIAAPVVATGKVESRVLPAMTVARTLHVGPYEDLGNAYAAVSHWITDHGFTAAGPFQERYLNGPGDRVAPSDYRTEIELPIVPEVVAAPA
jgi:effector-binding domain-containing protein